jgi:hypothetical protein
VFFTLVALLLVVLWLVLLVFRPFFITLGWPPHGPCCSPMHLRGPAGCTGGSGLPRF